LLFRAGLRIGELVADGTWMRDAAWQAPTHAAARLGAGPGGRAVAATVGPGVECVGTATDSGLWCGVTKDPCLSCACPGIAW
jgi:hypothetical protein